MGPLELLDFVGLDVAAAIGDSLDRTARAAAPTSVPELIPTMVAAGKLGRKSGGASTSTEAALRRGAARLL